MEKIVYKRPKNLSDLIDEELENEFYTLDGYVRNPEYIPKKNKIIGTLEVQGSKESKPYLIPFAIQKKGLDIERSLNLLKFFDNKNLIVSFNGKYTNKKQGMLSRIFNIDKLSLGNYLGSDLF